MAGVHGGLNEDEEMALSDDRMEVDAPTAHTNGPLRSFSSTLDYQHKLMKALEEEDFRSFKYLINEHKKTFRNLILTAESPILKAINNSISPKYLKATYITLNYEDRVKLLIDVPLDENGNNFIQYAIKWQNTVTANQIFKFRENKVIEYKNNDGDNIVHLAVRYCPNIAAAILNEGYLKPHAIHRLVREFNHELETPMHIAVKQREMFLVRQLAIKGGDLEAKNQSNLTPLMLAAMDKNMEMVLQIAQLGAQLTEQVVIGLFSIIKDDCPLHILQGLLKVGLVLPPVVLNQHIFIDEIKQILDNCIDYNANTGNITFTSAFSLYSYSDIKNFISIGMAPYMAHLLFHPYIRLFIDIQYELTTQLHPLVVRTVEGLMEKARFILCFQRNPQEPRISQIDVSATTGEISITPSLLLRPIRPLTFYELELLKDMCRAKGQNCTTKFIRFAPQQEQ